MEQGGPAGIVKSPEKKILGIFYLWERGKGHVGKA